MKVPVLITGGDTTSCKHPKYVRAKNMTTNVPVF
jgi:hypothetical protein